MEIENAFPEKVLKDIFGHNRAARQAFIDAVEDIDLTQVSQFNRLPKNLIKKEGAGIYSFFPLGKKSDERLVMIVDPRDPKKLIFYGHAKHNSQYSVMLREAGEGYKRLVQQASRMPISAELTAKINEKVIQKTGAKLGTNTFLKAGVKKLTSIGLILGTAFGVEFCSGVVSYIPTRRIGISSEFGTASIIREIQKKGR